MCGDVVVDSMMLDIGIYATSKPHIYADDTTTDGLVSISEFMKDKMGNSFVSNEYIENLKKCRLVDVEVVLI